MLTREQLLGKLNERVLANEGLTINRVEELAPGVLAVQDSEGDWEIVYDDHQYTIAERSEHKNIGPMIGAPEGMGVVEDERWDHIDEVVDDTQSSEMPLLCRRDGGTIAWHPSELALDY